MARGRETCRLTTSRSRCSASTTMSIVSTDDRRRRPSASTSATTRVSGKATRFTPRRTACPAPDGRPSRADARRSTSVVVRCSSTGYIIQKGLSRQVVLYWYQGRGRVIANEYANKLWLMVDAARLHRTNGSSSGSSRPSRRRPAASRRPTESAADFARFLYPSLSTYLP